MVVCGSSTGNGLVGLMAQWRGQDGVGWGGFVGLFLGTAPPGGRGVSDLDCVLAERAIGRVLCAFCDQMFLSHLLLANDDAKEWHETVVPSMLA
mmetsp:Transcript_4282/g.7407  ORF Transcript_4282/g.7407 Transcript_4282/m.7407 type:complete len:94 (+) Transcript_4282:457-738(+)